MANVGCDPVSGGRSFWQAGGMALLRCVRAIRGGVPLVRWLACFVLVAIPIAAEANQFVQLDFNLEQNSFSRDTVFIELFDDRPVTRDNFLQYVDGGHFDGMLMHRLARNFVLQGGGYYQEFQVEPAPNYTSLNPDAEVDLDGNPATPNPSIVNEFSNSPFRSNARGTLAMAKLGGNPDSATSEFFFNIGNNGGTSPNGLDYQNGGFTVFAQVVGDGMSYIDAINVLQLVNLNPDTNNDGVRDGGPFFNSANDAVPILGSNLVIVEQAKRINYRGAGSTTNVPASGYGIVGQDMFVDTGAAFTGTGFLAVGADRTLGVREGMTLDRAVVNYGTVAPGLQLGRVTFGSYDQRAIGTLDIDLRQATADTGYDTLAVTNTAQLNGKLQVSLLGNFIPQPGNEFTVLTAGSIFGSFSTVELPQLLTGLVWDFDQSATAVKLSVAAADFNRDGVVDAADYTVWRNARGTTVAAYGPGDGNGDTQVDAADYLLWKNNYGNTSGGTLGSGAAISDPLSVPEPATGMSLAAGFLLMALRRRRRR